MSFLSISPNADIPHPTLIWFLVAVFKSGKTGSPVLIPQPPK
jgi:hypothetical protein